MLAATGRPPFLGVSALGVAGLISLVELTALAGVAGTGAAGALHPSPAESISGVSAAGVAGALSLTATSSPQLVGASAIGGVGFLGDLGARLAGAFGIGAAGTIVVLVISTDQDYIVKAKTESWIRVVI